MFKVYMTYAQCVQYLQTTIFDDEISMKINVSDVGKIDSDGVSMEEKYAVSILLTDGMEYEKLIILTKVRDNSPYYFRSLDKVFKELLWKRDSCLCMRGYLGQDFYEKEYFKSYFYKQKSLSS
ncbi:TPA: hypothetical protein ACNMTN_005614 [Klebsiella pneumoniae]